MRKYVILVLLGPGIDVDDFEEEIGRVLEPLGVVTGLGKVRERVPRRAVVDDLAEPENQKLVKLLKDLIAGLMDRVDHGLASLRDTLRKDTKQGREGKGKVSIMIWNDRIFFFDF
jgi:hypothetical protein